MKHSISKVSATMILDSRGFPTVQARVETEDGALGVAAVPSGASTGKYEAVEKRDGDETYGGNMLRKAIDYFAHLCVEPSFYQHIKEHDEEFFNSELFRNLEQEVR